MIARVIVDVATNQTDRFFDYFIPPVYEETTVPGVRVIIPFGPRKVQGFVMEVVDSSQYDLKKIKSIIEVVDVQPPLTQELLDLSVWLKEQTLSFHIAALKVMLPAAMRAKYKKEIKVHPEVNIASLPIEFQRLFPDETKKLDWDDVHKHFSEEQRKLITKAIKEGKLITESIVGTKETSKKRKIIKRNVDKQRLKEVADTLPKNAEKQKQLLQFFLESEDGKEWTVVDLLEKTHVSRATVQALVKKGYLLEEEKVFNRDPYEGRSFKKSNSLSLTSEQSESLTPIITSMENNTHETFLLRGVTGSGKTEVYLQAIEHALKAGKEAIVLVPEISLTPQMVTRFKERFGSLVAVLHSALSKGEKYDEWRKIRNKEVRVVVGARSAIFAPFENLGIVIIDEEHETSYKQEESPRYHARDVAIKRGSYFNCPVILGSATPSLESYARGKKGVYHLLTMDKRVNDVKMPTVNVVDMRDELKNGNRSMFSNELFEAIIDRKERNEQVVLFLNRRGYSTFIMCRDCGYVAECPHCDISLTYHRTNQSLQCHYCGYTETVPTICPECESDSIRFFGSGTQKVEEEIKKVIPGIRVIRMDVDTTRKKGAHEKLLNQFGQGEGDVLLGTQMIAKGLDFPNITLVGVLAADSMLHLPDFRSSERTFQLLTQVSGRAGRHEKPGEVIVQSYTPDHYSIQDVKEHDYVSFFQKEMYIRKQGGYPPYYYLTLINISDNDLQKVVTVTENIVKFLKGNLSNDTFVYGPVASAIPRIKDRYRYQCMIKYKVEPKLIAVLQEVIRTYQGEMSRTSLSIVIDTNPYMML
ncbi:primosomal protein N' [Bacillus shivajii]|uniref:primosomal protein N' n=1 Tax=Bacillus shivajii TaxID=1983719 RepID=UPI001CFB11AF|nr:primosomal protein N' [Bacillus shivajii]UCZ51786.1 primosomal protein N' [Bacillus shivajii]